MTDSKNSIPKETFIKKPFSLYTYYLIAVLSILIIPPFVSALLPNISWYFIAILFPVIIIGVLLVGYLKWRRYRHKMREGTYSNGLLSFPAGMPLNIAIKNIQSDHSKISVSKKGIPDSLAAILILGSIILFYFLLKLIIYIKF